MPVETVEAPDVIAAVRTYLLAGLAVHLPTFTVVTSRVPNPRPAKLVRVYPAAGGPARRAVVIDEPAVGFEVWAPSDVEAFTAMSTVRALVYAMPAATRGDAVRRVAEFAAPALLPDPASDTPRAVWTALLSVRGSAAGFAVSP